MKISFCTTCMNRLSQLRRTLPKNIAEMMDMVARLPVQAELALLNYNSQDGVDNWIRQHYAGEIAAGILRYGHERSVRFFHASKAKNLAHRLATGDILVNLDADNYIGPCAHLLYTEFSRNTELVLHMTNGRVGDGTCGRIALTREWFFRLGGYDESLGPVGYYDVDLVDRAEKQGLTRKVIPGEWRALLNTKEDTVRHTGYREGSWPKLNAANARRARRALRGGRVVANPKGFHRYRVFINLATEAVIL